jgi:hypothetical protein
LWDNFIGQQIRRCNRNLLVVNLLLLGAVVAYTAGNYRYLANVVLGATDISNAELANLHDLDGRFRFFVRVHGEKSFETGVQSVEQTVDQYSNEVQSTTIKAEYRILVAGDRLLVVRTDPSSAGETFTGALETMPPSVYQQVVTPAIREEPRLQGMFLPAMLNANDYRVEGWWTIGIVLPLLAFIGWNLWKWQRRFSDYRFHPICWRMSWFGRADDVVQHIETSIQMNPLEKIGSAKIYGPWLFERSFFGLTCFHLPDVIWAYQKVTKHSVNFIPTGKSFSVLLNDRHGYSSEIQLSKKNSESFLGRILHQYPWIVAGYTDERKELWKSQRAAFIAAVEQRRTGTGSVTSD